MPKEQSSVQPLLTLQCNEIKEKIQSLTINGTYKISMSMEDINTNISYIQECKHMMVLKYQSQPQLKTSPNLISYFHTF